MKKPLPGPGLFLLDVFTWPRGPFRFYVGAVYGQAAHEVRVILVRKD